MNSKSSTDIPPAYNPASVEQRVYQNWLDQGYFTADRVPDQQPFTIIMPPPNVTGELHLGHALEKAIEDALVRWHRMRGEPTLWLPGTDHAGIATQWAVERQLAEEGKDRHQMGREEFIDLVWEHVGKYGGIIHEQSRRLGISADWTRHKFTLDPGPSQAVRTTFVNLYNKGLIYRHERIINWCPRCATALSDLGSRFPRARRHPVLRSLSSRTLFLSTREWECRRPGRGLYNRGHNPPGDYARRYWSGR